MQLTDAVTTIPTKVKELFATMCGLLPDEDLKKVCTTKSEEVVKEAATLIGSMCSSGVKTLEDLAKKGCETASTATDGLIKSAATKCADAMSSLEADVKDPLTKTCTTVTDEVTGVVGGLCTSTTEKLNTGLEASCKAIGESGRRRLLSIEAPATALVVVQTQSLDIDPAAAVTKLKESLGKACMCIPCAHTQHNTAQHDMTRHR